MRSLLLLLLLAPSIALLAQPAPDCAGCNCTFPPIQGITLSTQSTAGPCPGTLDLEMDLSNYGRFYGAIGHRYTLSLCDAPAGAMIYITTNTSVPGPLICGSDTCGSGPGPSIEFVPPLSTMYRVYVFDGSCGNVYGVGTLVPITIECAILPPPANDLPCGAIHLPIEADCNFTIATTTGATNSQAQVPGVGSPPSCTGALYVGADVWFTTTVPPSGMIGISTQEDQICAGAFQLYAASACNGTFSALPGSCTINGTTGPNTEPAIVIDVSGLGPVVGDTIYIRYWERNGNENGTFGICAYEAFPPANDEPCGAIEIPITLDPDPISYSTENATPLSTVNADPVPADCGGPAGNDIWFEFTVPDPLPANGFSVNTYAGTLSNMAMAWYVLESGSICGPGSLELIACDDGGNGMPLINSNDVAAIVPGEMIHVQVWSETPWTGDFSIDATLNQPPVNDDPCGAIALEIGYGCEPSGFTNEFATPTGSTAPGTIIIPDPSCGGPVTGDVWFTAIMPASGQLLVDVQTASTEAVAFAAYMSTGECTTNDLQLTEISCSVSDPIEFDLFPGVTVYIRAWRTDGGEGDLFICAGDPAPPPGDCYYTLNMFDAGGDGWNGSYVTVCIGGVCSDHTVLGSSSTVNFGVSPGQSFTVSYTAVGGGQSQNSYLITQYGQPVYVSGTTPQPGMVFNTTVSCDPPPAPNSDCLGGMWICNDDLPFTPGPVQLPQQSDDLGDPEQGCLEEGEHEGIWQFFRISPLSAMGATLAFEIVTLQPADSTVFNFALWGPYIHPALAEPGDLIGIDRNDICIPQVPPLRCSYANVAGTVGLEHNNDLPTSEDANGTGFVRHIVTNPYEMYALYVDRKTGTGQYAIEWQVPPPGFGPQAQIDCIGFPTNVSIEEMADQDPISLFPNPNHGTFSLQNNGASSIQRLIVIDIGGRIVHEQRSDLAPGDRTEMDLGTMAPGIYTVRAIGPAVERSLRLVIH